jgi:glutamate-1-semialdehyde 2,1-aminomutase
VRFGRRASREGETAVTAYVSSQTWLERARRSIPGGVPGFHRLFPATEPLFVDRGRGAWVYDTDGRAYLDFVLGKGPVILGHAHEAVTASVIRAIQDSPSLGLTSPVAIEAAETLLAFFPAGHQVRFHKSGSEACAAAVRMARAHTGRRTIVSSGYHGWHDWCSPGAPGSQGDAFADFHYDLARLASLLERHGNDVAAVIVEPQPGFLVPAFYAKASDAARSAGALFILDEVKSAFRVPTFIVASALASPPDLVIAGKAMANGFCVSCVVGPSDLMALSDSLHVSTTFDFETGPLAAIRATVPLLGDGEVPAVLCARAETLAAQLNEVFEARDVAARAFPTGAGFRIGFLCPDQEAAFYAGIWREGMLLYPFDNQFLSLAHGAEEFQRLNDATEVTLAAIGPARERLGWRDAAGRLLNGFPNRKGFLSNAPGPDGTARCVSDARTRST